MPPAAGPSRQSISSASDISNTNNTVNQFLGGKRKSWMVNATDTSSITPAASPRPATRTSPRRVKATKPATTAPSTTDINATTANTLPSPVLTDEPSPQAQVQAMNFAARPPAVASNTSHNINAHSNMGNRQPAPTSRAGHPTGAGYQGQSQLRGQNGPSINNYVYARPNLPSPQQSNKRRRVTQANSPSLAQYIPMIDNYIQESTRNGEIHTPQEQIRFTLLREACRSNDYFYVAFHQVLCLWEADGDFLKNSVASMGQNDKWLHSGMCHMLNFLRAQEAAPVAAKHQRWFQTFPTEFAHLRTYSSAYNTAVSDVATSLGLITQNIQAYVTACVQRRYPPTADEIASNFRLLSPIAQRLMFTWVRRHMGIPNDQFANEMMNAFMQSQSWHGDLAARINTAYPPTQRELEEATKCTRERYFQIRDAQAAYWAINGGQQPPLAQGVSRPPMQSPVAPSPTTGLGNAQALGQAMSRPHSLSAQGGQGPASPAMIQSQGQALPRPSSVASHHSAGSPMMANSPRMPPGAFMGGQFVVPPSSNSSRQGSMSGPSSHVVPSNAPAMSPLSNGPVQFRLPAQGQTQQPQPHRPQPGPGRQPISQQGYPQRPTLGGTTVGQTGSNHQVNTALRGGRASPLIPGPNTPARGAHLPNPDVNALHMLDRRSPSLKPVDRQEEYKGKPDDRYYQVVRRYVVGPTMLKALYVDTIDFKLEKTQLDLLPGVKRIRPTDPDLREVRHGSLMYRVRCVKLPEGKKEISQSQFVVADAAWPDHFSMEMQIPDGTNVPLSDVRRKKQFGKDLPLDITKLVTQADPDFTDKEESKTFKLCVSLIRAEKGARYAVAVEEVEVVRHDIVAKSVLAQRIEAKTTEEGIKKLLGTQDTDEDGDIIMASNLVIDLQDPWAASLWKTPARSKYCLHRECFDLHNFLETRPETRKEKSVVFRDADIEGAFVSAIDVWRCPTCGVDARPENLIVDEWMVKVREKLVAEGKTEEAKGIIVGPDASWKIKEPAVAQNNSRKPSVMVPKQVEKKKENVVVIDLDDD